ncbi:hypothetical protein Tco_0919331 [Tanacetum coccineum]
MQFGNPKRELKTLNQQNLSPIEELLNNDPSSPLPLSYNPLSGSTTSSSPDHLLEEFADELALITFPPGNDDLPFDIESDLREIEYYLTMILTKKGFYS